MNQISVHKYRISFRIFLAVFTASMAILGSSDAQAETLLCRLDHGKSYSMENAGVGVFDIISAVCEGQTSKKSYEVITSGYGVAFRFASTEVFTLICPFRSGEELTSTLYGIKADVQFAVGIRGGLFYGSSGACIMTGGQVGAIGASLVGAELQINRR